MKSFENAKTRLGTYLGTNERTRLSEMLLRRTISTLKKTFNIEEILLVSSDTRTKKIACKYRATFLEAEEEGVNSAVNLADKYCVAAGADASIVLPIDLPLMSPEDINIVCESGLHEDNCVILCPSYKLDGSNVLLRKPCNIINTSYDANSYPMHVLEGIRNNIKTKILFVRSLMIDIDTIQDIRKLLAMNESDDKLFRYLRSTITKLNL